MNVVGVDLAITEDNTIYNITFVNNGYYTEDYIGSNFKFKDKVIGRIISVNEKFVDCVVYTYNDYSNLLNNLYPKS